VATIGVAVYLGSRLLGQQPATPQYPAILPASATTGAARTHIAVINVGQVIKNYKKFQNFEADLKSQQESAQKAIEGKKGEMTAWEGELRKPETSPARREELERNIKQAQRQVQDYLDELKQRWSKAEFDTLVQIFKEVHEAAQRYAIQHDIDLVLQYNDPVSADYFLPAFFSRKLNNQACMPLAIAAGMDITAPITDLLNGKIQGGYQAGTPRSN
jgi:Skp family chaperone for outer membrane proteins